MNRRLENEGMKNLTDYISQRIHQNTYPLDLRLIHQSTQLNYTNQFKDPGGEITPHSEEGG